MDYLRRRALGRLAEVLGPDGVSLDVLARTVGLNRIAREELRGLPAETMTLLEQFSAGVNACIVHRRGRLPIEFDLLDYVPEPWTPLDSVAVFGEFRWYLTGRLPVIAIPELAKRVLGDGALYRAFLTPEAGQESIVPPGFYPPRRDGGARPVAERETGAVGAGVTGAGVTSAVGVGEVVGSPDEGAGSNNWVVAGSRSATGLPLLSSDPHIAFGATSCWYEAHLSGGSFNAAGMAYVGVPVLIMGRNERVAWGITNNICSLRDLYQERTDPAHPGCFLYDGAWEPAREIVEEITVRGGETVRKTITYSRNGPIVDDLLPPPAQSTGPVSLRWLGAEFCDELTCAIRANRARTCAEFRDALRDWRVPTWSFVFADIDGHIGYQCAGKIPVRENWDRGYRPGWEPAHQWTAYVPFDGLPAIADPPHGWIRSANNRTAPEDFPYPLSGTWSSGHRAMRIRQMLEEQDRFTREDFARMQMDALSIRAVEAVPPLLAALEDASEARVRRAAEALWAWNRRMEPDEAGAALFELFFAVWCQTVAAERFPPDVVDLIAGAIGGLANALLAGDPWGWFARGGRDAAIIEAFRRTLDDLEARLGPDMSTWTWGRVHRITLRHFLSGRGDLAQLLDRWDEPVRGSGVTVCNTGYDPNYLAAMGANYRLIGDLGATSPGLWATDSAGTSGDPGSPHYCDQLPEWLAGRHHFIPLDRADVEREAASRLALT
jgi:penicillin amidase